MKTALRSVVIVVLLLGLVLALAPASTALAAGAVHTHPAQQAGARPALPMETHLSVLLRALHPVIAQAHAHSLPAAPARSVAHLGMPHIHPVPPPALHQS